MKTNFQSETEHFPLPGDTLIKKSNLAGQNHACLCFAFVFLSQTFSKQANYYFAYGLFQSADQQCATECVIENAGLFKER